MECCSSLSMVSSFDHTMYGEHAEEMSPTEYSMEPWSMNCSPEGKDGRRMRRRLWEGKGGKGGEGWREERIVGWGRVGWRYDRR